MPYVFGVGIAIALLLLLAEVAIAGRNGLPGRRIGGGSRVTEKIEQWHLQPPNHPEIDRSDEQPSH